MVALLESYASYVPALILARLERDPTPLDEPVGDYFAGAVLAADISGFTALTERLMQHGAIGVEELSIILNAYFGRLIDIVIDHGGDIIEFTGDGILALWPTTASGEDMPTLVYRAGQCALAVQHVLHGKDIANGTRISLRIGIGAGYVLIATVGGLLGRWELLMAGAPLVQVSAAQEQARPGEVVLSPEAWNLVQEWCIGYPVGYAANQANGKAERMLGAPASLPPQPIFPSYTGPYICPLPFNLGGVRLEDVRSYIAPRPLRLPSATSDILPVLRGYLPGALLGRLDAGLTDWVAELRRVTVIFLNMVGLDYEAPDILDRLQAGVHAFQTILYHYEGSLNQFIVDDKGTSFIAALGLPPLTHEDDAVRGVQLALEVQEELRTSEMEWAIGIATGQIFCGSRGSPRRSDYAMIGNTINLAARLMQAAPDSILCDTATYQAAHHALTFDALPPLTVKGRSQPVAVYRPRGQLVATSCPLTHMVGRIDEQTLLDERLHALENRAEGSVIIIEGEAGMGKSRLVSYLLQQAQARSIASLVGRCDAVEQATPYHPWKAIFWQIFDLDELPDDPHAHYVRVQSLLHDAPDLLRLLPLINVVLPLDIPDNETTAQMSGKVRADNTRDLLLRVLHLATSYRPRMIVLEDAGAMDSTSWALTMAAGQYLTAALLIITTRPLNDPVSGAALLRGSLEFEVAQSNIPSAPSPSRPVHPVPAAAPSGGFEYGHLLRHPTSYRLTLASLPPDATIDLVCQTLGVRSVPERVAELILEKAQGNPFFSQELAYALRDMGLITIHEGICQVTGEPHALNALSFPDTIQGVILSRIDRLAQEQQLTLKVASVIGYTFSLRILRDIYPIESDRPALANHLRRFEQLDIVLRKAIEPETSYEFKHVITQEVVYNTLLFAQRRELHRAVAQWYEHTYFGDLSPFYTLLAHHWSKADVPAKVIDYSQKAGEQALNTFANQSAVDFLSQALALYERENPPAPRAYAHISSHRCAPVAPAALVLLFERLSPLTARLAPTLGILAAPFFSRHAPAALWHARASRQLGEAHLRLGNLPASRAHLENAAALFGEPPPATTQALGFDIFWQVVLRAQHRLWPVRCPPERQEVLKELAAIHAMLLNIYYFANQTGQTIYASLRNLNLVECIGYAPGKVYAYANMCIALGTFGFHTLALRYGRRAMQFAWRVGNLQSLIYALNLNGLYRLGVGHWRAARGATEQAAALSEKLGDWTSWGINWTLLAQIAYYQGNFEQSHAIFTELYATAQHKEYLLQQGWALGGQGQTALRLGRLDESCAFLTRAINLLHDNAEVPSQISNYGLLAMAHLHQGNHQQAQQAADAAWHMIADLPFPATYYLFEGYAGVVEVYLALWEAQAGSPDAPALAQRARAACKELLTFARTFPIGKPRAWLWQGGVAWLEGNPTAAHTAWHKSLTAAEQLAMRYEEGLAHRHIGQHASGEPGRYHLERASEIFAQVGAAWEADQVEQLRRAS